MRFFRSQRSVLPASSGGWILSDNSPQTFDTSRGNRIAADALSMIEIISPTIDYAALAQAQQKDTEIKNYLDGQSPLTLNLVTTPGTQAQVYCDISTTKVRSFITKAFRKAAFNTVHQQSRPDANVSIKLATERFVWPSIKKDCRRWTK